MAIAIYPNEELANKLREISRTYATMAKLCEGIALDNQVFDGLVRRLSENLSQQHKTGRQYCEYMIEQISEKR